MRPFVLLLLTLAIGIGAGWFLSGKRSQLVGVIPAGATAGGPYRCAMHPWVKSEESGACTVCGMALTTGGFGSGEKGIVHLSEHAIETLGVRTVPVMRANLSRSLEVAGRIVEDETRRKRLAAYVPGRIEKLHVNFEGAEVGRGDPLATVYSPLLLEAEREYRLLYRQSQMNHSTKITAEHGRLLEAMKQRLTQYGLTPDQIKRLPGKLDSTATSEILSPMDGVVTSQRIAEGQYVKEGEPMFEIVDLYTVWFEFDVYETDLPLVKTGQRIRIRVPGTDRPPATSLVSFINPNLNPVKRTAEVRAELRNPVVRIQGKKTRNYYRQMYAEGTIELEKKAALVVPRAAVLDDGQVARVFVAAKPGVFEARTIQVGFRGETHWEIASGIKEGESVAVNGAALIDSQIKL